MKDGGPAFPRIAIHERADGIQTWAPEDGMSLRDWFAAAALFAADLGPGKGTYAIVAEDCYNLADAMLAERAKATTGDA